MRHTTRIIAGLIFMGIAIVLMGLPYDGTYGESYVHNLLEELAPDPKDYYLNSLCAFSLFLPAIVVLESFFIHLPFQKKHRILFGVQALGTVLSWPFILMVSSGPVWGPVSKMYFTSTLIQVWSGMAVLWSLWLFYVSFSGKEKRRFWPFTDDR